VDEDSPHLDAEHRRVVDEGLEAVVVHADVADSLEETGVNQSLLYLGWS